MHRFIKGFITRNQAPCVENQEFLQFVRTNWLSTLAQNLPKNVLDKKWISPPPACAPASEVLRTVYYRLMVRKYVRSISPERKEQLQMKLEASQLFKGKKSCYEISVPPYYKPNYLSKFVCVLCLCVFVCVTVCVCVCVCACVKICLVYV